jgi:hypothetical protein
VLLFFFSKENENDKAMKLIVPSVALLAAMGARIQSNTTLEVHKRTDRPAHAITWNVERATKAVNYGKRSGLTNVDVRGTALLPEARGKAKVARKEGHIEMQAEFVGLQGATRFGAEYLTYVLWAITPEGCATNLVEVVPNDTKSEFNVRIDFDVFGLIVTAEPYFAVSQPSDMVVMENVFGKDTVPKIEEVDAKYQLLPRGSYTANVSRSELKPIVVDPNTPLDLYEARNALWIALWAGAEEDAAELFAKAERSLQMAEAFHASRAGAKEVLTAARETVQTAENARAIALKRRFRKSLSSRGPSCVVQQGALGRQYVDNE